MMKTPTKFIALLSGAALLASSAFAQGVATNPVGYITLDIAGTGGVGSSAVSVLGAPLQNAVDVAGALTGVSGTTLTSSTAAFGSYAGAHYIQITSGSNVGVITTVLSSTATTLTTADDISTLITGDENFEIRAYTTLADVFGAANEAGIGSGASSALADELLVYNGEGFDIYYYQEGHAFATDGWRLSSNAFGDASATEIASAGTGFVLKRKGAAYNQIDESPLN